MTPEQLRDLLAAAVGTASAVGDLPSGTGVELPPGLLFRPASPRRSGVVADWVTPVAQRWAAQLGTPSKAASLARALAPGMLDQDDVATVEVAPSGLVALTLEDASRARIIEVVRSSPETYALGEGRRHRPVLERAGSRGLEDPLRPVQLAHARLCRLLRNGEAVGVPSAPEGRLAQLHHVDERHLLVALADLPQRLDAHAADADASRRALVELATSTDRWHQPTRPTRRGEDPEHVHGVRLLLADAARIVLRNGLGRLGAAAPERM